MKNPKAEIRRPKEGRNPKTETIDTYSEFSGNSDFGLRPSFGFRPSDFFGPSGFLDRY
jgi:hypothetical protein